MENSGFYTAMSRASRNASKFAGQMTLGEFIAALKQIQNPDMLVMFDFAQLDPGNFGSYRGEPSHLALSFTNDTKKYLQVSDLLFRAKEMVGKTFEGYKGDVYKADLTTPLWAANEGVISFQRIVGIHDSWAVFILTKNDDIPNDL